MQDGNEAQLALEAMEDSLTDDITGALFHSPVTLMTLDSDGEQELSVITLERDSYDDLVNDAKQKGKQKGRVLFNYKGIDVIGCIKNAAMVEMVDNFKRFRPDAVKYTPRSVRQPVVQNSNLPQSSQSEIPAVDASLFEPESKQKESSDLKEWLSLQLNAWLNEIADCLSSWVNNDNDISGKLIDMLRELRKSFERYKDFFESQPYFGRYTELATQVMMLRTSICVDVLKHNIGDQEKIWHFNFRVKNLYGFMKEFKLDKEQKKKVLTSTLDSIGVDVNLSPDVWRGVRESVGRYLEKIELQSPLTFQQEEAERFYQVGRKVQIENGEESFKWHLKAAALNHSKALTTLGFFYSGGGRYWGMGVVPVDYAEAAKLYRLAAKPYGNKAQRNLMRMYESEEIPLDPKYRRDYEDDLQRLKISKAQQYLDRIATLSHSSSNEQQSEAGVSTSNQMHKNV